MYFTLPACALCMAVGLFRMLEIFAGDSLMASSYGSNGLELTKRIVT